MVLFTITVVYQNKSHCLEVDDDDSLDVLRGQICSMIDVAPEQQILRITAHHTRVFLPGKNGNTLLKTLEIKNDCRIAVAKSGGESSSTASSTPAAPSSNPSSLNNVDPQLISAFAAALSNAARQSSRGAASASSASSPLDQSFAIDLQSSCTKIYFGSESIAQPSAIVHSSSTFVCIACATTCFPPNQIQAKASPSPFVCGCASISGHECLFGPRCNGSESLYAAVRDQGKLVMGQHALQQQQMVMNDGTRQMIGRIQSHIRGIQEYENRSWHEEALRVIPVETLKQRAAAALEKKESTLSYDDEVARQLLHWFKHEFFQWINSPNCSVCNGGTSGIGGTHPNAEEAPFHPGVVEVYRCNNTACGAITRFPRYNHACKLLQTKKGRCGEWAQAFTLCARAMGYRVRHVVDWTDHVWTELWSKELKRWVHFDPCENVRDGPLMYEGGWGKKLTYVIAFCNDHIADVTLRYTKRWKEVSERRTLCSEVWLKNYIDQCNLSLVSRKPSSITIDEYRQQLQNEQKEFGDNLRADEDARKNAAERERQEKELKEQERIGRQTGTVEWRAARGELGKNPLETLPSSASAPATSSSSIPSSSPPSASTPSSTDSSIATAQKIVKAYFAQYIVQLSNGCGDASCTNQYCASSAVYRTAHPIPLDKNEAARIALKLSSSRDENLCPSSRESVKKLINLPK